VIGCSSFSINSVRARVFAETVRAWRVFAETVLGARGGRLIIFFSRLVLEVGIVSLMYVSCTTT